MWPSLILFLWSRKYELNRPRSWQHEIILSCLTVFAQTQRYYVLGGDVFQLRLARFFLFNTGKITLRSHEHVIPGTFSIFIPCTNLKGMEVALSSEWWETTSVWKFCVSSLYIIVWWSNVKGPFGGNAFMKLLNLYNDAMELFLWPEAYVGRAKFQLPQVKKECCFRSPIFKKIKLLPNEKRKT